MSSQDQKLHLDSFGELLSSAHWTLVEQLLSHLAWFAFNLIFFSNAVMEDDSGKIDETVGLVGSCAMALLPLVSFLFFVQVEFEHLARKYLWTQLIREGIWVNFKNRSLKKGLQAYYFVGTACAVAFAVYVVPQNKAATIFGAVTNGVAAYLSLKGMWDFESNMPSLNRVLLDGPWLQDNHIDMEGVQHLVSCTVINEFTLKCFCFSNIIRNKTERKSSTSDNPVEITSVSTYDLKSQLHVYQCDHAGYQGFKSENSIGCWKSSFYATLFMALPFSSKDSQEKSKTIKCRVAVWGLVAVLIELFGIVAVEEKWIQ
eukprot:CAMPEP_0175141890 /NCGR_PEP_ID=MMETSP0087-20121206/12403_1 /TAXON_ID=136419 /ORGANISM="Unknown Unknown, Strain D1" /LENGTH=314 /DNA_ID=CAMNT_0016425449 /DNA_START=44 /DNA_END=988 /DNA_ORIENTATION=+